MKKIVFVFAFGLFCQTTFAGNGTHINALSAQALGMGGTGAGGITNATEALYKNPALLGALLVPPGEMVFEPMAERNALELTANLTDLNATVSTNAATTTSAAGPLPNGALAWSHRIDNRFTFGLGAFGYGGANFDYSSEATLAGVQDTFKLYRIVPAFSYVFGNTVSIGLAPYVSIGSFQLNSTASPPRRGDQADFSLGVQLGAWFRPWESVQFGVAYTSGTRHVYGNLIDLEPFTNSAQDGLDDVTVTEPHEFSAGTLVSVSRKMDIALDYRLLLWGDASGYKNFAWKAQHVGAFGLQYKLNSLTLRAGYSFATSPLKDLGTLNGSGTTPYENKLIANNSVILLDATAFAGIVQHHISAGVGMEFFDSLVVDAAFVLSPKSTLSLTNHTGGLTSINTGVTKWIAALSGTLRF